MRASPPSVGVSVTARRTRALRPPRSLERPSRVSSSVTLRAFVELSRRARALATVRPPSVATTLTVPASLGLTDTEKRPRRTRVGRPSVALASSSRTVTVAVAGAAASRSPDGTSATVNVRVALGCVSAAVTKRTSWVASAPPNAAVTGAGDTSGAPAEGVAATEPVPAPVLARRSSTA